MKPSAVAAERVKQAAQAGPRYPIEMFWSDEDEGYIARARDLPGCSAWGASIGEALHELEDAIAAWIQAAKAAGNPIPLPSDPARETQPSGKFLVRIPRTLHAELIRRAEAEGVSLNQFASYALATAITVPLGASAAQSWAATKANVSHVFYIDDSIVRTAAGSVAGSELVRTIQRSAGSYLMRTTIAAADDPSDDILEQVLSPSRSHMQVVR